MKVYRVFITLLLAGLSAHLIARVGFEGDTWHLVGQADAVLACARQGQWAACPEGMHFPLIQIVPTIAMRLAGVTDKGTIVRWLAHLSFLSFCLIVCLSWKILRPNSREVAGFAVFALLSGYWIRYSNLSFGEMTGALFVFGVVYATMRGSSPLVLALVAWIAGIHKDPSPPFIALLGLSAWWAAGQMPKRLPFRSWALGLCSGLALALASSVSYNWFKFGTPYNQTLLSNPNWIIRDPAIQAKYFVSLLLSPQGGIVWFGPAVLGTMVGALFYGLRSRSPQVLRPVLGVWIVLLALTAGFSKWFAPFGWYAWGARFHVVWLPALFLVTLVTVIEPFEKWLKHWASHPGRLYASVGVWTLLAWPQFRVLIQAQVSGWILESGHCPPNPGEDSFLLGHRCAFSILWPSLDRFTIPWSFVPMGRPDVLAIVAVMAATFAYSLIRFFRQRPKRSSQQL